jgi:hypothetical protein
VCRKDSDSCSQCHQPWLGGFSPAIPLSRAILVEYAAATAAAVWRVAHEEEERRRNFEDQMSQAHAIEQSLSKQELSRKRKREREC